MTVNILLTSRSLVKRRMRTDIIAEKGRAVAAMGKDGERSRTPASESGRYQDKERAAA